MMPATSTPVTQSPLSGVRVLDLSRVLAGPWCTQTLADLGADVIKVERPKVGDDTRTWGPPFLHHSDGSPSQESAYYLCANRNKRSICCDIASPEGQALIRDLAKVSDVFVENYKVGDMARYGLDFASLHEINPKLVYCSVTGYGQVGPYSKRAGYDYAIQGTGGLMSITGERDDLPGGGPQKVGVAVADLFTGMYASTAVLAALRHAENTGQGQHVDMSLLDTQVAMLANHGASYLVDGQFSGSVPGRMGNAHANVVPYQVFETLGAGEGPGDYVILAIGNDGQFNKFCTVAGHPEWADDARFIGNANRLKHREDLVALIADVMRTRSKADWLSALSAEQVPCGPVNNIDEVFQDPHVQSRAMVNSWQHPLRDGLQLPASPIKLSATPVQTQRPPPLLGQHTDEVLSQVLQLNADQISRLRRDGIIG